MALKNNGVLQVVEFNNAFNTIRLFKPVYYNTAKLILQKIKWSCIYNILHYFDTLSSLQLEEFDKLSKFTILENQNNFVLPLLPMCRYYSLFNSYNLPVFTYIYKSSRFTSTHCHVDISFLPVCTVILG